MERPLALQKGFTLVEILVAVALLAIIGTAFLGALTLASRVLLQADTRETARDIAEAQIEYIQNQNFIPITGNVTVMVGATLTATAPANSSLLELASTTDLPGSGTITIGLINNPLAETRSYTVQGSSTILLSGATANNHNIGEPVYVQYSPSPIPADQANYAVAITAKSSEDGDVNLQDITVNVYEGGVSKFTLEGKKVKWQ